MIGEGNDPAFLHRTENLKRRHGRRCIPVRVMLPIGIVMSCNFSESSRHTSIAVLATAMIAIHLILRYAFHLDDLALAWRWQDLPLFVTLVLGGLPLIWDLVRKAWRREFGSDLLAGTSIVTSLILGEYLAGNIVVLMLAGGSALEAYAVRALPCWKSWRNACLRLLTAMII